MKSFKKVLKERNYSFYVDNSGVIVVDHKGYVYLSSLTSLPENTQFNNQGSVYLQSLTEKYQGCEIKTFDGYSMKILSSKIVSDFNIHRCEYLGMNKLENKTCFVANKGKFYSHGKTIKEAIEDVNFKYLQENLNVDKLVSEIKQCNTFTVNDYILLTGACREGCKNFLKEKKITKKELSIKEVMSLTKGYYGYEKINNLFNQVR